MENKKIESRPGKVTENENLAKSHGKVMEFGFFTNISHISFQKMCWLRTLLLTHNDTD